MYMMDGIFGWGKKIKHIVGRGILEKTVKLIHIKTEGFVWDQNWMATHTTAQSEVIKI